MSASLELHPETRIDLGDGINIDLIAAARAMPIGLACLHSGGTYIPGEFHQNLQDALMLVEQGVIRRLQISVPPQHGKALISETKVLTPKGWVKHGDLKPGDVVYGRSGKPVKVVAESPVEVSKTLEVEFSDGAIVRCHPNHEWTVYDRSGARGYRTIETKHLLSRTLMSGSNKPRYTIQVDYAPALQGQWKNLPVDPYVLGAWLGDGTSTEGSLTHSPTDQEVVEAIEARGYTATNAITHPTTGCVRTYFGITLLQPLRDAGLECNKHIPEAYQQASIPQRRDLLAGLIDTDGCVSPDGSVRFVNTNKRLVDDVTRLIRSLGYYVGIQAVEPTTSTSGIIGKQTIYYVRFTPHDGKLPCVLPRKKWPKKKALRRRRAIVAVREGPEMEMKCIQVDAPDGLYLVTEHLIPTHNSTLTSEYFPAWYLGKHPDRRVILSSYADTLATKFGRDVRDILTEFGPTVFGPRATLKAGVESKSEWELEGGGGMLATGIGGGITGRGSHLFVVDDPVKGHEDARSTVYQERNLNWFKSVATTRMAPKGAIVIVQTRWHLNDLSGAVLKEALDDGRGVMLFHEFLAAGCPRDFKGWVVLNYPALALEDDPLGRQVGEALFPERYTADELRDKLREMGTYQFNALYQGTPAPEEGGLFKREWYQYARFQTIEGMGEYITLTNREGVEKRVPVTSTWLFQTVDVAASEAEGSDYTVISTWMVTPDRDLVLLDVMRRRADTTKHNALVINAYNKWHEHRLRYVGVEKKVYGLNIIEALRSKMPMRELKADKDKVSRALVISALYESGRVYHLAGASWLGDWEEELVQFPNGKHDDQVDTAAYAGIELESRAKREVNVF